MRLALILMTCALVLPAHDKDKHGGAWQAGWDRGYREGMDHGNTDRHRSYDLNSKEYQKADAGYDKHFGDKGDYKKGFREGYRTGYDQGYYGRPAQAYREEVYPRPYGNADRSVSDPAYDNGYRDGRRAGDGDFRRNRSFSPEDHDDYRDGDRGYVGSYGEKRDYRDRYRDGYLQGYRDAFRGR